MKNVYLRKDLYEYRYHLKWCLILTTYLSQTKMPWNNIDSGWSFQFHSVMHAVDSFGRRGRWPVLRILPNIDIPYNLCLTNKIFAILRTLWVEQLCIETRKIFVPAFGIHYFSSIKTWPFSELDMTLLIKKVKNKIKMAS